MSEADARIVIDRLLREAGWDPEDKSQVKTERPAARHVALAAEGKEGREFVTGDTVSAGRTDDVLLDSRSRPLAVIEAKSPDDDDVLGTPSSGPDVDPPSSDLTPQSCSPVAIDSATPSPAERLTNVCRRLKMLPMSAQGRPALTGMELIIMSAI